LQAVEGLLGTSAEYWLRMQHACDLAEQAVQLSEELEPIPTLKAA
jgi:plasmid maintenance system antidote protein VapI